MAQVVESLAADPVGASAESSAAGSDEIDRSPCSTAFADLPVDVETVLDVAVANDYYSCIFPLYVFIQLL